MTKMATIPENYKNIRAGIVDLLKIARSSAARNVNTLMTATYSTRPFTSSASFCPAAASTCFPNEAV